MEITFTTECPNCNSKLQNNFFGNNQLIPVKFAEFVREFTDSTSDAFCDKCYPPLKTKAIDNYQKEKSELEKKAQSLINNILIVSINSPFNWDYEVIGMVTGQSTTGTGIFSEFSSSIADFFGSQSGAFNKKIAVGEELCAAQMRMKCLQIGGNAIIATDIDYAEVGGDKGMLLVCMSGTAVNIKNTEIIGEQKSDNIKILQGTLSKLKEINRLYYNGIHFVTSN